MGETGATFSRVAYVPIFLLSIPYAILINNMLKRYNFKNDRRCIIYALGVGIIIFTIVGIMMFPCGECGGVTTVGIYLLNLSFSAHLH